VKLHGGMSQRNRAQHISYQEAVTSMKSLWFTRPVYIKKEEEIWHQNAHFDLDEEVILQESRKTMVGLTVSVRNSDLVDVIKGFSSHLVTN